MLGFLGVQRKMCGNSGPSAAPSAASPQPLQGRDGAAGGLAERREFSGLLLFVLVSLTVSVSRAVGHSPGPLVPPSSRNESRRPIPHRARGFFPAFLFLLLFLNRNQVRSQRVPLPQVPKAGHCTELQLRDLLAPSPGADCCFFLGGTFHLPVPTPPQFSDRVQGRVGLFSFLTAAVAQSPSLQSLQLSAALANQCLTLA